MAQPYTKFPNRYTDRIKPRLTSTQRDICDIVIRQTYGWHRTAAAISNTFFSRKASRTVQGIIKAKKQLITMGLLILLKQGGGSQKSEYMLDLYYDDPERSVKASLERQENPQETPPDPPDQEPEEIPDPEPVPEPESTDPEPDSTAKLSSPPSNIDQDPGSYIKEKHTEEKPPEKRKAVAAVCSKFHSLFCKNEKKDYGFFGWALKNYGFEKCVAKIEYMAEHQKRHIIRNPKAFFRSSLINDYQPSLSLSLKMKGDQCSRREVENFQDWSKKWDEITSRFNYQAASTSLQNLMASLE